MYDLSRISKRVAILGIDAFIGSHMFKTLNAVGFDCLGTTRRSMRTGANVIYLDLLDETTWGSLIASKPEIAIAFFAISKLNQCENDPVSNEINSVRIPALLATLARCGCKPVLLSTNSIFGGGRPLCDEDERVEPNIAYSRQKDAAENRLRALLETEKGTDSHTIVRITRAISQELPPFREWLVRLRAGLDIEAFDDFIFAPMTLPFVCESLLKIALSTHGGIFHLSGTDVSYYDLAREIAEQLGMSSSVIRTNSTAKRVPLRFRPRYSALGMSRTTRLLGLQPQPVAAVTAHLLQSTESST